MAESPDVVFLTTQAEVRAAWRQLVRNGGYSLYVDADGRLHALRIGVDGGEL